MPARTDVSVELPLEHLVLEQRPEADEAEVPAQHPDVAADAVVRAEHDVLAPLHGLVEGQAGADAVKGGHLIRRHHAAGADQVQNEKNDVELRREKDERGGIVSGRGFVSQGTQ